MPMPRHPATDWAIRTLFVPKRWQPQKDIGKYLFATKDSP